MTRPRPLSPPGTLVTALVVAAVVASSACSATTEVGAGPFIPARQPATAATLIGPWQPTPFLLDPGVRARAEHACRREIELPGEFAAVVDARGASVVTVRMTGARSGSCDSLEVQGDGEFHGAGAGWNGPSHADRVPIGESGLAQVEVQKVGGGSLKVTGWSVYGRVGSRITTVVVQPVGQPAMFATVENGWFAAWWPAGVQLNVAVPAEPRFTLRGYDATGVLVEEYAQ